MQVSKFSRLRKAAESFIEIERAGLLAELKDQINAVRYRQRIDRQRQPVGMTPWLLLLAGELSRLTDLPRSDCEHAMREVIGTDWPSVAIGEIIEFATDHAQREVWK
jgi:hypothetical protein